MVKPLRSLVRSLSDRLWQARARLAHQHRPTIAKRVMLLPTVSASGCIGDEAMLASCLTTMTRRGCEVSVLTDLQDWPEIAHLDAVRSATSLVLPGEFASRQQINAFLMQLATTDAFLVLGADMMDGGYGTISPLHKFRLLELAALAGCQARVLGFSFSPKAPEAIVRRIGRLHRAVALLTRDPRSHQRLSAIAPQHTRLVADVAFQLVPREPTTASGRAAVAWVDQRRARGRRVLGLNANHFFTEGADHAAVEAGFVALGRRILSAHPDLDLLWLPHDRRLNKVGVTEFTANQQIAKLLIHDMPERVAVLADGICADEVKYLTGRLAGLLSGRMHAVVASLGAGTPAMGMVYQGKFEGLFEHCYPDENGDDLCVVPADLTAEGGIERMGARIDRFLARLPELRPRLAARLPAIRAMSLSNFDGIGAEPTASATSGTAHG